jgi:large subunit ribosomal protein L24
MATNSERGKHNCIGEKIMQKTKNPRKQRKRLYQAPAHIRHKLMTAPLSPELLGQRGVKALPVRKGDTVRVMRGDHKGFDGKISRVDLANYRVYLEGLTREKVDGTTVFVGMHPSKVMIRNLNLNDKIRKAILERRKIVAKKGTKAKKTTIKKAPAKKEVEIPEEQIETGASNEIVENEEQSTNPETTIKTEGGT